MRNDIECYKNLFDLLLVLYKMREYLKSGNFKNDALPTKKLIVFEIFDTIMLILAVNE